ncbi:MAG: hypothetical protein ACWGNI_00965 [Desulfobacterales bacterium]
MSFQVPVVGGEVTGREPEEFTENTHDYEQNPTDACSHILGVKSNKLKRIPSSVFSWASHKAHHLWNLTKTKAVISQNTDNDLKISCDGDMRFGELSFLPSSIKFRSAGPVVCFTLTQFASYSHIKTLPSGSNYYVWSDGFIEYSSLASNKENISDISNSKPLILNLIPRAYTQGGVSRMGFVVEESPEEFVKASVNDDNTVSKGIDIMSIIACLTDIVKDHEARIVALERR